MTDASKKFTGWPDETIRREVYDPATGKFYVVLMNRYELCYGMANQEVLSVLDDRTNYLLSLLQENQ